MKIYVSNLFPEVTEEDLRRTFAAFGEVTTINLVKNKGCATVEMADEGRALRAMEALRGKNLKGRPLKIARPKGFGRNQEPRRQADDRRGGTRK